MAEQPQDTTSALQPDNLDLIPPEMQQYAAMLAGLTTTQQRILWALIDNLTAENKRSERQIAKDIGVDRTTIQRARKNKDFQSALAYIVRDNIRGLHDQLVNGIIKHGATDWRATKFLLEYDGSYVQRSQNMNINARLDTTGGSNKPFSAVIDDILIRMGELGWSRDRVEDLGERFDQLRAEGAF